MNEINIENIDTEVAQLYPNNNIDIQMLEMTQDQRKKYIKEFTEFIDIETFIGNYSIHFILLLFLLSGAIILILIAIIDEPEDYWYIIYSVMTFIGFLIFGYIGYKIKRKQRKVMLETFIDYIFYRLMVWTKQKIRQTSDVNEQRILIENLMSTFYDYTKFKGIKLWNKDLDLQYIYDIIDASKNQKIIDTSLELFDKKFKSEKGLYMDSGVLIVLKIFMPILYLSSNPYICNKLLGITRNFMQDTKMNVFSSKVVTKKSLIKKEIIIVRRDMFKEHLCFVDLFENFWECKSVHQNSEKKLSLNRDHQIQKELNQIRALSNNKRKNKKGKKKRDKQAIEKTINEDYAPFSGGHTNKDIQDKDIFVQNNPFGIDANLFQNIKKKKKSKKNEREIISSFDNKSKALEDIDAMKKFLEDSHLCIDDRNLRTICANNKSDNSLSSNFRLYKDKSNNMLIDEDYDEEGEINIPNNFRRSKSIFRLSLKNKERTNGHNKMDIVVENFDESEDESQAVSNDNDNIPIDNIDDNQIHEISIDKRNNKSILSIDRYEIPEIDKEDARARPKEIDEFLSIALEPASNFKLLSSKEDVYTYKRQVSDSPILLVRCDAVVNGNIETIFELITNMEKRSSWDVIFSRLKILKVFNEYSDVMYSYIKAPPMVTDRDFLQKRSIRRNIDGFDIVIAFTSYEDKEFPPIKSTIRAQTIISGYALKKIDENTTKFITVSQTDIKGFIPIWLINKNAAKAPFNWVRRLEKAIKETN